MSGFQVNAGGSWRKAKGAQIFTGGAWRKAKAIWVNTGGAWRKMSFSDSLQLTIGKDIINEQPPEYQVGYGVGEKGRFGVLTPNLLSNGNSIYGLYSEDVAVDVAVLSLLGGAPRATYTVAIEGYGTLVFSNMVSGYSDATAAPGIYNWFNSRLGQTINITVTID